MRCMTSYADVVRAWPSEPLGRVRPRRRSRIVIKCGDAARQKASAQSLHERACAPARQGPTMGEQAKRSEFSCQSKSA